MNENAVNETETKPFPVWAKISCVIFVIAAALHSADKSIGGGDTWVAMACGRYMLGPWAQQQPNRTWQMKVLDTFGVHATQREPFSATSRPYIPGDKDQAGWVNQNWLTHVIFYKMKTVLGENSIVVYKFVQAILTALFAFWAARVLGAHYLLAAAAAGFGVLLSRSFIDLRPNVSSILFAILMILLLAYWKKKKYWALAWMVPITIIWANVHGGFIYAIMIFTLICGAHFLQLILAQVWPSHFTTPTPRAFAFLAATTLAVWLIPGIFSPFGWENLIHPLVIAVSDVGDQWRQVIEWQPIWKQGFGNATPYVVFLSIYGLIFLFWLVLYFFKPVENFPPTRRRQKEKVEQIPWPKIDLAHLAIIAITLAMSLKSRRFIFLGGVILSPFMASMAQEVCNMFVLLRQNRRGQPLTEISTLPMRWILPCGLAATASAAATILIFVLCMNDTYLRPQPDGYDYSIFRRMVRVQDQPVDAMKFLADNNITGVVFNGWTHGGFVAFSQPPHPDTGQPPCKVFMDGRAQAAYAIDQFNYWNHLKAAPPKPNEEMLKSFEKQMKKMNLPMDDPASFDKLLDMVELKEKNNKNKKDPFVNNVRILALHHPLLYTKILERENLNVALLDFSKQTAPGVISLLQSSGRWQRIYLDNRYVVLVDAQSPANRHLFEKPVTYPTELSKGLSLGLRLSLDPQTERKAAGLQMLKSVNSIYYLPVMYDSIYNVSKELGQWEEMQTYFSQQYATLKEKYDRRDRFGRHEYLKNLWQTSLFLARIATHDQRVDDAGTYKDASDKFLKEYKQLMENHAKGGWFW